MYVCWENGVGVGGVAEKKKKRERNERQRKQEDKGICHQRSDARSEGLPTYYPVLETCPTVCFPLLPSIPSWFRGPEPQSWLVDWSECNSFV